ncbi:MAG: TOBE domain-containing protein, partial [Rhizobiaceae bacterium]|nr:TOBE domain-containing protein [Rhizobiaceae bacterium]
FLGMPPMNFLQGELQSIGDKTHVVGDGFSIELSASSAYAANAHHSRSVTLGIRPSDLTHQSDAPDQASIDLDVVVSEYIGAQSVLICNSGDQKVVVELKSETPIALGQRLRFALNQTAIHLFDRADETAITSA